MSNVFSKCLHLRTITLPILNYIGESCFLGCISLIEVCAPKLKVIDNFAFENCKLKKIDFPNVEKIAITSFEGCEVGSIHLGLKVAANFPSFQKCTEIEELRLPNLKEIPEIFFQKSFSFHSTKIR